MTDTTNSQSHEAVEKALTDFTPSQAKDRLGIFEMLEDMEKDIASMTQCLIAMKRRLDEIGKRAGSLDRDLNQAHENFYTSRPGNARPAKGK